MITLTTPLYGTVHLSGGCRTFLLFAVMFLIVGCGAPTPVKTTLSSLSAVQKDFDGRQVIVSGTLRTFAVPRHYWIENDDLDRVALIGTANLVPLVGQTITVRGMFRYDAEAGRRIELDEAFAIESKGVPQG